MNIKLIYSCVVSAILCGHILTAWLILHSIMSNTTSVISGIIMIRTMMSILHSNMSNITSVINGIISTMMSILSELLSTVQPAVNGDIERFGSLSVILSEPLTSCSVITAAPFSASSKPSLQPLRLS